MEASADEEFQDASPDKIHEMMDRDHAEAFGHSLTTTVREDEMSMMSRRGDFSMGDYFKHRSSYPFPSLNGEITLLGRVTEEPERDSGNVSRRSVPRRGNENDDDSLFASFQEPVTRASPKFRQDSMFGSIHEGEPRTSPGLPQDSMFAVAEKESGAVASEPVKLGQDSMFTPVDKRTRPGNKVLTPRNSDAFEPTDNSLAQEGDVSDSSIRSLQEFFADPEKSPMSSTDIMEYVLEYCRVRQERGSGKGIVKDLAKREKAENLSMLSRRLSQELGDRRISYNDFSTSLRKKISSSRCSTPDVLSVKSGASSKSSESGSSRKSIESSQRTESVKSTTHQLVPSSSRQIQQHKAQNAAKEDVENRSPHPNSNATPPQQVQIQLNLPPTSAPTMQNFPGPLIINIICPQGYSQGSAVQRVDLPPDSNQVVNVRANNQEQSESGLNTSASSATSKIAVQFSGCIQWK